MAGESGDKAPHPALSGHLLPDFGEKEERGRSYWPFEGGAWTEPHACPYASSERAEVDDLEGVQGAGFVADRDVLADRDAVAVEAEGGFVVFGFARLVIDQPSGAALAAGAVDQQAGIVVVAPEALGGAIGPAPLPERRVEMAPRRRAASRWCSRGGRCRSGNPGRGRGAA